MKIDHVGIVVNSLEKGIQQWEQTFGYKRAFDIVENTRQQVFVVFMAKEESITIKLIEPATKESPVYRMARKGGELHHLCFLCDNINLEIPILQNAGARLIVPPEPDEAFNNRDIAFLLAGNDLNVELIDTTEKKGWRDQT